METRQRTTAKYYTELREYCGDLGEGLRDVEVDKYINKVNYHRTLGVLRDEK